MTRFPTTRRSTRGRGSVGSDAAVAPASNVRGTGLARLRARLGRLRHDDGGSTAVEFALVCAPFVLMLLYALQIGIFYMTQSALDTGVVRQADALQRGFGTKPASMPSASSLKTAVATGSGALVATDGALLVELRQMTNLSAATVPITDGVVDYGSERSVLVLRAQSPVLAMGPGFSTLQKVTSTAIVRRQGW